MNKTLITTTLCTLWAIPALASTTKPFLPIPTPYTQVTPPADPDHFSFIVGGDNRSAGHGSPMPPSLDRICREIGIIHPPFVLWTGDCIEGYGDSPAEANAEYDVFLASAAKTGVPFFNAPGNHEFSLDKSLLPVYEKRMGSLYGSFDYGHSHFIALDTTPVMPDGTISSATLDPAQWAWLESDLKANSGAKNIFVMLHHYVFGPPDVDTPDIDTGWATVADRDRFHALMVKYGVRAVFTGHNHRYWHVKKDGVDYYISGGAGAPLDASPEQGGYLHYITVSVDGASVSTQILQPWLLDVDYPDGDSKSALTERVWASNYNNDDVHAGGIVLHLAAPPAGQTLTATAAVAYKKKARPGTAQVVAVTPSADGKSAEVVVAAVLPAHRTVEITVTPSPQAAGR